MSRQRPIAVAAAAAALLWATLMFTANHGAELGEHGETLRRHAETGTVPPGPTGALSWQELTVFTRTVSTTDLRRHETRIDALMVTLESEDREVVREALTELHELTGMAGLGMAPARWRRWWASCKARLRR